MQVSSVSPVRSWSSMCANSLQTRFSLFLNVKLHKFRSRSPSPPVIHPSTRFLAVLANGPNPPRKPQTPDALPFAWHCRAPALRQMLEGQIRSHQAFRVGDGGLWWLSCVRDHGETCFNPPKLPRLLSSRKPSSGQDRLQTRGSRPHTTCASSRVAELGGCLVGRKCVALRKTLKPRSLCSFAPYFTPSTSHLLARLLNLLLLADSRSHSILNKSPSFIDVFHSCDGKHFHPFALLPETWLGTSTAITSRIRFVTFSFWAGPSICTRITPHFRCLAS